MKRITLFLLVIAGVAIGIDRLTLARSDENGAANGEHVKVLASYDVKEKLDGKDAAVTMVEVSFGPGGAGASHRHPGPAFVYVVEGTYELGIDDQPPKTYKAGETFREPSGALHRVSRNPSSSGKYEADCPCPSSARREGPRHAGALTLRLADTTEL
jgi:quercetin dioxygenase-like cupin family protein